jgi:hypothetical protein
MIRRTATLAAFALVSSVFVVGCTAPADEEGEDLVLDTSSAATDDCASADSECDPTNLETFGKVAFTFSFNSSSLVITGRNGKGQTLNATITSATRFRLANLRRYEPADPYLPSLQAYNAAVASGSPQEGGVYSAISSLSGDTARVWVNKKTGTVRAFRPVASF